MRLRSFAIVAVAATATCTPLSAAAREKPSQRQVGDATAQCTAGAEPAQVRALLATLPGSAAELRAARRLAPTFDACSESAYRLTAGRRGAGLFNGRADLAAAMAVEAADRGGKARAGATAWYLAAIKTAAKGSFDPVLLGVQEFGACVVAASPADALALVRSAPGSREEGAAVTALQPALAPCIGQEQKMNFTRDELRLAVAEPLYHALTDGAAPAAAS